MFVKKFKGRIVGAIFNRDEKKAMDLELGKQTSEWNQNNAMEIDATILWTLHEKFGWGPVKLKRFHDAFIPALDELCKRYEMGSEDTPWLCTKKLRDYGINLEEWMLEEPAEEAEKTDAE